MLEQLKLGLRCQFERSTRSASSITAALQQKSTITVWAWAPQTKDIVTAFEKKYPNVTVNLVNAGTTSVEYTKLQNAIKAGSGIPDVAQIEYYALPQFALIMAPVQALDGYGFDSLKSDYSQAVWDAVDLNGQLDALPQDTGPMAMFYNEKVFKQYGLTVPTTWAQYLADAQKLHAANPNAYITSDAGDPGFVTSMIWDAGGHPFGPAAAPRACRSTPPTRSIKTLTNVWDQLVSQGLLDQIPGWTSQWYTALGNGTIATLPTGAWMPGNLETSVTASSGDWRVAPMPTWTAGAPAASAESGGSSYAVLKGSKNALVAAAFDQFMNAGEGETIFANEGGFPSLNSVLTSSSFGFSTRPRPTSAARRSTRSSPRRPPRCCPAGPTCRSRSTPTASSRPRSARPTPISPTSTRPSRPG